MCSSGPIKKLESLGAKSACTVCFPLQTAINRLISLKLNHHQLKLVGLKEPIGGRLESAEAASSLWGNMEVTIVLLNFLCGTILHNDFIGNVAGGSCEVSPPPYVATPEVL